MDPEGSEPRHWLYATAAFARDLIVERWAETRRRKEQQGAKEICYFSMEFLIGRLLTDTLRNLGVYELCSAALAEAGINIEAVAEQEIDAALGDGGLGRLAACLLESTATTGIPAYGYGIRYEFGMFAQRIEGGWQHEEPEARPHTSRQLLWPCRARDRRARHRPRPLARCQPRAGNGV
jgi:starch phosphorylase